MKNQTDQMTLEQLQSLDKILLRVLLRSRKSLEEANAEWDEECFDRFAWLAAHEQNAIAQSNYNVCNGAMLMVERGSGDKMRPMSWRLLRALNEWHGDSQLELSVDIEAAPKEPSV